MVAVPFPVTSSPGARPQEGAGRLINAYAIKTEQGAATPLKWMRSPGLRQLTAAAGSGPLGSTKRDIFARPSGRSGLGNQLASTHQELLGWRSNSHRWRANKGREP